MATLKIFNDGKRITTALSGDIDHHAARQLREELDGIIERSQPELLILDLENVGFMDSSGIGLILGRMKSLRDLGGELLIKNARPEIAEVIGLSGLSAILVKRRADKPNISILSGNSDKSGKSDNSLKSGKSDKANSRKQGKSENRAKSSDSSKPSDSSISSDTDKLSKIGTKE